MIHCNFLYKLRRYWLKTKITPIICLLHLLIVNIQWGYVDVAVLSETKVGVCNYRSKSDPLEDAPQDVIRRNVEHYRISIEKAKSEEAQLIVFPEGGLTTLTPFIEKGDTFLKYSLNIADWEDSCPCDDHKWSAKGKKGEAILKLSCAAKSNNIHVVVNILEKEEGSSPNNIFNTNLVFNNSGYIIVRYRKIIPDVNGANHNFFDKNEFTVNDIKFKTIIGNDIYNQSYNFSNENEGTESVNIVWSTASKRFKDLPALIVAQIFGKEKQNIFISDYGDDECSSSCIYYKGTLYTSFGESDDKLILVPSENEKYNKIQELKQNCLMQFLMQNVEDILPEECKIIYNPSDLQGASQRFFRNLSTEHADLEISICGISANKSDISNNVILKSNNITITRASCDGDKFLPITANSLYWPLKDTAYEYSQNQTTSQLNLMGKVPFTILSLMRIRNTSNINNCKNDEEKMETHTWIGLIIIFIVLGVVLVISLIVLYVIRRIKKSSSDCQSRSTTAREQEPSDDDSSGEEMKMVQRRNKEYVDS